MRAILLIERGFPPRWLNWILSLLQSSTSRIKLNGLLSPPFKHKRGLRQGDPLSPMLFIIAADALQRFLTNAMQLSTGNVILPPRTLQFADDTVIIMDAQPRNLMVVQAVLKNFAQISGLHINENKSVFVPIALCQSQIEIIKAILNCDQREFPIAYLGLPLSVKKLNKRHFEPIMKAVHNRLQGWHAKFLSFGGRLTLVKSVLSALPLHFLQAIKLPVWLIEHIDRARRSFLWKGKEKCLGGHCLVSWAKCCLPTRHGGLGILNLRLQNECLLTRWIWKLRTDQASIWTSTVQELYGTVDPETLCSADITSYGLRDILQLKHLATFSTTQELTWRWSSSGLYTSASLYKIIANPGAKWAYANGIWKCRVPPKVKIFAWLLLQNKILTQQNLQIRGWPSIQGCCLCGGAIEETTTHLFLQCTFACRVWDLILDHLNLPSSSSSTFEQIHDFWFKQTDNFSPRGKREWEVFCIAGMWEIWKMRNAKIFTNKTAFIPGAVSIIKDTARQWLAHY